MLLRPSARSCSAHLEFQIPGLINALTCIHFILSSIQHIQ